MNAHYRPFALALFTMLAAAGAGFASDNLAGDPPTAVPWPRHVIDDTLRGADGVRLADVNGDGLADIATGWEESGQTRVYLNPGEFAAKRPWPAVTVGSTPSVEDAVFCDLDGDGAIDVISSCEGDQRTVNVHWAPADARRYLDSSSWSTEAFPSTIGRTQWMFALPMQVDGKYGQDIVVASKGENGLVGWLQAPANPRKLADWKLRVLYRAGWVMSVKAADVDDDGDSDLVLSDRRGRSAGALWLENPGEDAVENDWPEHRIGAEGREVMFLDVVDLDGDKRLDVVAAVKPNQIQWLRKPFIRAQQWKAYVIEVALPPGVGRAKAVKAGDLDNDGAVDLVYSCEGATPPNRGVVWLRYRQSPHNTDWTIYDVSGPDGVKFDRMELLDLDADGDLDILTCEERHEDRGLGVIWYENPYVR